MVVTWWGVHIIRSWTADLEQNIKFDRLIFNQPRKNYFLLSKEWTSFSQVSKTRQPVDQSNNRSGFRSRKIRVLSVFWLRKNRRRLFMSAYRRIPYPLTIFAGAVAVFLSQIAAWGMNVWEIRNGELGIFGEGIQEVWDTHLQEWHGSLESTTPEGIVCFPRIWLSPDHVSSSGWYPESLRVYDGRTRKQYGKAR